MLGADPTTLSGAPTRRPKTRLPAEEVELRPRAVALAELRDQLRSINRRMPFDVMTPSALAPGANAADCASMVTPERLGSFGMPNTCVPVPPAGKNTTEASSEVWGRGFRAEPFDPVFVMASFTIAPSPAPLVEPDQWGFAAQGFVVGVLSADAAGDASYGITIPNQPALRGAGIWLMGVSGSSVPLRMSAPLGGKLQ